MLNSCLPDHFAQDADRRKQQPLELEEDREPETCPICYYELDEDGECENCRGDISAMKR